MLRMTVEGVGFDHHKQTVVVLKDWDGRKILLIWIGPNEAKSIALELEGAKPPRPLSHDLLLSCIEIGRGRVARVVINDLQEGTFFATIDIDTPRGEMHIDSRPSDAIALAVRAKCPIFVDGSAIEALIEMNEITADGPLTAGEAGSELLFSEESSQSSMPPLHSVKDMGTDDDIDRFKRLIGELDLSD